MDVSALRHARNWGLTYKEVIALLPCPIPRTRRSPPPPPLNPGQMWLIQLLLPLFCPIVFGVFASLSFLASKLAARGLPPTTYLFKMGWRPQRDFSLRSLTQSYLSPAVFYLNL